ncbi:MAG: hypothetical protein GYB31_15785 [Bacteroidetes bacterium]|nr:hypothetical protein [Bacteroidota bacterium]
MTAKNISLWASKNPVKSRIIILLLHVLMAPLLLAAGILLYIRGVDLPVNFLYGLIALLLLVCVVYPGPFYRKVLVAKTWRNRKIFDAIVLGISIGVMIFFGNALPTQQDAALQNEPDAQAVPIVQHSPTTTVVLDKKELRKERKSVRQLWRTAKKEIRQLRKEFRQNRQAAEANLDWLWILLLCLGAIIVWYFLILLACSISCNGMEALGAVVGIGGTALVILGLILGIRAILKHNKTDLTISP